MISSERNFSLAINGERISGQEIRNQNVTAVMSIANIVKSSLGPVGLDKMLVDNIGVSVFYAKPFNFILTFPFPSRM